MPDFLYSSMNSDAGLPAEERTPAVAPFPIVGVGASAGGLEPFTQLLTALPSDTGMAFVLVQHLDPTHKSQLTAILSRVTSMSVREVVHGMAIQPNHVYVIPPDTILRVAAHGLDLSPRPLQSTPHLTIDEFFQSLAAEQGRLSIGIVLSGTGADGSQGIKAIKTACGLTFAQEVESAQYGSMPRSAIATGAVDFILSPAQIAGELARISRHHYLAPADQSGEENLPDGDGVLQQFFSLILRATGVDFSHYKQTTLRRRIGRRMIVHRCDSLPEYLKFVRKNPDELKELYRDFLINVTSFFRDPEAFDSLAEQLSSRVQPNQYEHSFRAWIPGCSTGEEVYSLAILVRETFEKVGVVPHIQFFGTDISERALETARAGVYEERQLQGISAERLSRHFTEAQGLHRINKTIRELCIFARHDVTHDTPYSHLDLISCRNMLIYLEPVLQKGLMPIFHFALEPAGLLFLGSSETIGASTDLFTTVDSSHRIFSRQAGPIRLAPTFARHRHPAEPLARAQVQQSISNLDLQKKVDRTIQDRYAPDSVVINEELQILQFRGHIGAYLEPAAGEANYHLLRMAREGLQYGLREVVARAISQNVFSERKGIRLEQAGVVTEINVEVIPLASASDQERFFLVVFSRATTRLTAATHDSPQPSSIDEVRVSQLELQLAESRLYQRGVAADYEAVLEELRAANEELQSSNEELQSSNEELETTKEELQSANEELSTVNEELDTRNRQLAVLNDDLTNLFGAVNVPILRVDKELRLQRFTPAAQKLLGVGAPDLDQPIRELQSRLGASLDLETTIREVMGLLTTQGYDVRDLHGCWWSLTVRPYRTADDRLDGAVLTFTDIDSIQRALQSSQEARLYADAIVETVREPLMMLTSELRVARANAAFYKTFRLLAQDTEGMLIYELADHRWASPALRSLLEATVQKNNSFADFEWHHDFSDIGMRRMLLNARQLQLESKPLVLLAFEDITERRRTEEAVAQRLEKTDIELDHTKAELRALAASLINAREEEQRRIARELHDDLLQRLAFLHFQVEQFRMGPNAAGQHQLTELLTGLERELGSLTDATRNISHQLHPAILEDLGLVAALRKLAKEFKSERSSPVRFTSRGDTSLVRRGQFAGTVYRIAQEALHNASKHAPEAPVSILFHSTRDALFLTIKDLGPGFDATAVRGGGGLGFINMQERARLLGGTLRIQSKPGKGTTVTLQLPLPHSEQS
jgi:two-component system, chemotaxis family, CheB/CheR fusion protein